MANATGALAAALCAAAAAATTLAGAGVAAADDDPAQREEIIRRETAGLDKSIAGIRDEIGRVKEASAGRSAGQEHGGGKRGQDRFDPRAIRISFLESEIERLEGLKADLGGHGIATMLAQGTAYSAPGTAGMFFRVSSRPAWSRGSATAPQGPSG